jgi:acyl-CoA synthetase (AMP-forming)/AMP-acid ligase II
MAIQDLLDQEFATIPELIAEHAREAPHRTALIEDERQLDFAALDAQMNRVAAALQRDGIAAGSAIAICASTSIEYAVTFLGAVRAGIAVAPLAPSSTSEQLAMMVRDAGAKLVFMDRSVLNVMAPLRAELGDRCIALDDGAEAGRAWTKWLAPEGAQPQPVEVPPDGAFNIIYSSGTTGTPKGIVQPYKMRWGHVRRGNDSSYGADAVTIISTPLYSNTTLVSFFPGIAHGGAVVLMKKFDAGKFLELSQRHHVTHAMLVPVQYQRLMDHPEFDRFDLSSYKMKFCTSAPFSAVLKAQILKRWPGGLVEYYGMTEGGGTCVLLAHLHPDKLHTVGRPAPGHDIRLIDDQGNEVPPGEVGEVVGASRSIMTGYHNQPQKTADAEWRDSTGKRFIRTGDVGRFDADGFLTLMDRKKDMIISGGFNVYPSDLEGVLMQHPDVAEAAVVGVPSERWGETPVAFVVCKPGHTPAPEQILEFVNNRVGKTQRLTDLKLVESLPRSPIGKVLKRQLRDEFALQGRAQSS